MNHTLYCRRSYRNACKISLLTDHTPFCRLDSRRPTPPLTHVLDYRYTPLNVQKLPSRLQRNYLTLRSLTSRQNPLIDIVVRDDLT